MGIRGDGGDFVSHSNIFASLVLILLSARCCISPRPVIRVRVDSSISIVRARKVHISLVFAARSLSVITSRIEFDRMFRTRDGRASDGRMLRDWSIANRLAIKFPFLTFAFSIREPLVFSKARASASVAIAMSFSACS